MSLTPNQIAWCRKNISAFDGAWKSAKAADEHAAKVRERLARNVGRTDVEEGAQS